MTTKFAKVRKKKKERRKKEKQERKQTFTSEGRPGTVSYLLVFRGCFRLLKGGAALRTFLYPPGERFWISRKSPYKCCSLGKMYKKKAKESKKGTAKCHCKFLSYLCLDFKTYGFWSKCKHLGLFTKAKCQLQKCNGIAPSDPVRLI